MNWDVIDGKWKQIRGKAQRRWGKLTDNDWKQIEGKRMQLIGRLQELYGKMREEAERDVDDFTKTL